MSLAELPVIAPAKCESWLRLIEMINRDPILPFDSDQFREMLWLIGAHAHLLALPRALATIRQFLDIAPVSWMSALTDTGINSWRPMIDWVIDNRLMLTQTIGEHFGRETNTSGNNPVMGSGASYYPLYATLCAPKPAGSDEELFLLLLGHLLIASVTATREHSDRIAFEETEDRGNWKPTPNGIAAPALVVRTFSIDPGSRYLIDLPLDLPPEEFAGELEEIENQLYEGFPKKLPDLRRFLQKAWGIIEWKEGAGGGGGGNGGHRWIDGRIEVGARLTVEKMPYSDRDDPSSDWGETDIVKVKTLSSKKQSGHLNSDLAADEDDDDEEILLSDFDCAETKRDAGALARTAKSKARHVAKENQLLPWKYGGLSIEETGLLLAHVKRQIVNAGHMTGNTVVPEELDILTMIHIMLWTGSDAKRAAKTRIYTAHAGKFDGELGLILCSTDFNSGLCWRIKALEPDYKTEIAETSGQLRTRNRYIDLPDLINLTGILDRLLANRKKVRDGSPLFMASPEALEKSLKSWLKNYSPDGRITVHKLGEALWHHLFRESGDPALASCITGTRHPLARVRLHYTTPHVANLQAIYKRTVTGISDASYAVLKKQPPKVESSPVNSTGAVGARLCPTVDAVRHSFASLVNDIRKAANYFDRPGFTRYHNLYTLYTLQLFAYTTTCRAIVTPYMTLSRVHSERGIASLSDKDDEHRHKTRLIWIPPQVRDQMHSYDLHLACLHRQLIRPPTAVVAEPAFFLDHAFTPVMARPKIIGEHLSPYLNVRPNTHRRFLRTELIERGCTPEVADAFMGHWYEGEEPFGKYSSFSFLDYLKELQHYLLPLLQAIGPFPVLRSRLV